MLLVAVIAGQGQSSSPVASPPAKEQKQAWVVEDSATTASLRGIDSVDGQVAWASGSGGTVAVLCDVGERADAAIDQIMIEYEKQTGRKPEAFVGSSAGAWHAGTAVV